MFQPQGASRQCKKKERKKTPRICLSYKIIPKSCKTNPIVSGPAKIIIFGLEACSKITNKQNVSEVCRN